MQTLNRKLPAQRVPMIGRDKELAQARGLLQQGEVGLLTLTGPGGVGKTRLAMQIASDSLGDFEDGAFFIPLAPVSDASLVPAAIAQALSVREAPSRSTADTLKEYLKDRRTLLLLDNFEQVVEAAPLVSDLLSSSPHLKVLVTSREVLRIYGERDFPVSPLALPPADADAVPPVEEMMEWAAVRLFVERAVAARPDFALNPSNARAVAEICRRLDGLPLAIELAAARIRIMSPQVILARLMGVSGASGTGPLAKPDPGVMPFLTGGARDLPARQQTLRNAIAWSYNLLDPTEQRLFRLLSLFVGGCTFEAAEQVVMDDGGWRMDDAATIVHPPSSIVPIQDAIESLVNKSLLKRNEEVEGGARFTMLETIREYAVEQLQESGEASEARQRFATYYLRLAEKAEPQLTGPEQLEWLDLLEKEHDNLRVVLHWAETEGDASSSVSTKAQLGLRLTAALYYFWSRRGHLAEGRERILAVAARTLEGTEQVTATPAYARALTQAAALAYRQSDVPAARLLADRALAASREAGYRPGVARALVVLASVERTEGDLEKSRELLEQSLQINRELGDASNIANTLNNLGLTAARIGDGSGALPYFEEGLLLYRQIGDTARVADTLAYMAERAYRTGEYDLVLSLRQESLERYRALGDKVGIYSSLNLLGAATFCKGDPDRASAYLLESLALARELDDKWLIASDLEFLGFAAKHRGNYEEAIKLFSDALSVREKIGNQKSLVGCLVSAVGVLLSESLHSEGTASRHQLGNADKRAVEAAKVFGFAEPVFEAEGYPIGIKSLEYAADLAAIRSQFAVRGGSKSDEATFEEAMAAGRAMSIEEVFDLVMQPLAERSHLASLTLQPPQPSKPPLKEEPPESAYPNDLSIREAEVLRLIAIGKSNQQIAGELSLSINTVQAHLRSVYSKIGVTSRTEAALYARDHHLT